MFCDYSWERENTQHIKELVSASRRKGGKKNTLPYCFSQQLGGLKLIGCAEISNTLQRIWRKQGACCYLEAKQWFNTEPALCCFPPGKVRGGVTAVWENTRMHSIEQVFHRRRECEGQQSLPGVPERVETTTPRSNVSWRKEKTINRKKLMISVF